MSTNKVQELLVALGLVSLDRVQPYYAHVRDRDDIGVLWDPISGVIFLDRTDHMDAAHYADLDLGAYWGVATRAEALEKYRDDDSRRASDFLSDVAGKDVLDIGCGTGGFLDLVRSSARSVAGVELQTSVRDELVRCGYKMFANVDDVPPNSLDVITMFHTVEHLTDPIGVLRAAHRALRAGGILIVEVPHARDALLALDSFKAFTLWSEHLILHTRASISAFMTEAGFSVELVSGYQRYPVANHLGWLLDSKPGGQKRFASLNDPHFAKAYADLLVQSDKTDTLIVRGRK